MWVCPMGVQALDSLMEEHASRLCFDRLYTAREPC